MKIRSFGPNRGQAMIELALLIPFLIFLLIIFTEYGLFFLTAQKIGTLSREAAQTAFQDCRDLQATDRLTCMERVGNNTAGILVNMISGVLPGDYKIILTSWQMVGVPPDPGMTPVSGGKANPFMTGGLAGVSKYNNASDFNKATASDPNYNLIQEMEGLFSCEIFYKHRASDAGATRSITWWFGWEFSLPLLNNTIYSAGVS